jgi:type I restriction enzyme S subunit
MMPAFVDEVVARSVGVSYPAINASDLVRIRVPAPPRAEQQRLAEFLDRESERLDALANRNNALLQTQEHWLDSVLFERLVHSEGRVIQVGRLMTLQRGLDLPDSARRSGDIPVIGSGGQVGCHDESPLTGPAIITGRYGSVGNVQWLDRSCWPLNTTLYVRDFHGNDPRYLYHLLRALPLGSEATKSAVPGLHRADVHRMEVRHLSFAEQRTASREIDAIDVGLQDMKKRSSHLRSLLAEYRDALITEAVTGTLDVSRVSDAQMDERAHAAMEGEPVEAVR